MKLFLQSEPAQFRDSRTAAETLKGALLAIAHGAGIFHSHMTDFSGHAAFPPMEPAAQNKARPHAGAAGKKDHILTAPAGTELPLRQSTGVRIVLQNSRYAQMFFKFLNNGYIIPARQVGRREYPPGAAVQRASAADPEGLEAGTDPLVKNPIDFSL